MTEAELLKHFPNMSRSCLSENLSAVSTQLIAKKPVAGDSVRKRVLSEKPYVALIGRKDGISFSIEVVPRSVQFGKRMGINRKTGKMIMFCDKKTKKFYEDISVGAARFAPEKPLEGPLRVEMAMYFPRPQRLLRKDSPEGAIWMPSRPDAENLFKGCADPLTKLGFWNDDAQIVDQCCRKYYCAKGESPHIDIHIIPLVPQ